MPSLLHYAFFSVLSEFVCYTRLALITGRLRRKRLSEEDEIEDIEESKKKKKKKKKDVSDSESQGKSQEKYSLCPENWQVRNIPSLDSNR